MIFISVFILFKILKLMKVNRHFFSFFYMTSNIFVDASQIRTFLGIPLLLSTIYFYSQKKYILLVIFLIVLPLIHTSYIFYFFFFILLFLEKKYKKNFKYIYIFNIIMGILFYINIKTLKFIAILPLKYQIKVIQYTRNMPKLGILAIVLYYILISLVYIIYIKKVEDKEFFLIKRIYKYTFLIIPIFFINLNFYRILKIFTIIFMIFLGIRYKNIKNKGSFLTITFLCSIYWFIFDMYSSKILTRIIIPILYKF